MTTNPATVGDVRARLRAADDRVPTVERALLAARLSLVGDDLELLLNTTVTDLLELPASVTLTIQAARLLERLDAHEARAHPVDLERDGDRVVARVPLEDDDVAQDVTFDVTLRPDGTIDLDRDLDPLLTPDDAEALGYALIQLARFGRGDAS